MNSRSTCRKAAALSLLVLFLGVPYLHSIEGESPFQMLSEARTIARTGNYPEALEKFELVIEQANENEQKLLLAIALSNVAEIHHLQGNTLDCWNIPM